MHIYPDALAVVRALSPDEPVILNRPHAARRAARYFVEKFPGKVLYAVKANPAPDLIEVLWEAGCCMLLRDFTPLTQLAQQHTSAAAAAQVQGKLQQLQPTGAVTLTADGR